MKISVIIVSFNFERWLDRCLGSLRKSTIPVEIIVVDNCSTDNTLKRIEENYPEVILIKNKNNEGFGKANNIGIDFALKHHCDFVFLLNQDAWIDFDVVETLLISFKKFPEYGILSPVHLNGDGSDIDHGFSIYTKLGSKEDLCKSSKDIVSSNIINAAIWMIPSKIVHLIGGFSPIFYHSGEDIDYINRLHYHGYQIGYCPSIFGYHDRSNRELRKETLVFQLTEYVNINYSFPKAFTYGVLAAFKKVFYALRICHIRDFFRFLWITNHFLFLTETVLNVRKRTKKKSVPVFFMENK
jgi:GT2 family glycosyltransferase